MHYAFGVLAGFFSFSAYVLYIKSILEGKTKPSRTTWSIFAGVAIVLATSYKASGAESTMWVAISEVFGICAIALLSLKYGDGGREKTDIICLAGTVVSIVLWWWFNSPTVGLVASLTVDSLAIYPTIEKSWHKPETEDRFAWLLTQVGNLLNLFAIDKLTFGVTVYPIWLFILDGVVVYALYRKR